MFSSQLVDPGSEHEYVKKVGNIPEIRIDFVAVIGENDTEHFNKMKKVVDALVEAGKKVTVGLPSEERLEELLESGHFKLKQHYEKEANSEYEKEANSELIFVHTRRDLFEGDNYYFIGMGGSTPELFKSFSLDDIHFVKRRLEQPSVVAHFVSAYCIFALEFHGYGAWVKDMDKYWSRSGFQYASESMKNTRGLNLLENTSIVCVPHSKSAWSTSRLGDSENWDEGRRSREKELFQIAERKKDMEQEMNYTWNHVPLQQFTAVCLQNTIDTFSFSQIIGALQTPESRTYGERTISSCFLQSSP